MTSNDPTWVCIVDPTRGEDDPGLFYGRMFYWVRDLSPRYGDTTVWPDGIVFECTKTKKRITIIGGKVVDYDLLETNKKLLGKAIKMTEAARKYGIRESTLSSWIDRGVVRIIQRKGRYVYIDEGQVAIFALRKRGKGHDRTNSRGN